MSGGLETKWNRVGQVRGSGLDVNIVTAPHSYSAEASTMVLMVGFVCKLRVDYVHESVREELEAHIEELARMKFLGGAF